MSQNTSLEDERRALLEQIHSSRETYRRMLTKSDKHSRSSTRHNVVSVGQADQFPRSMTMRWLVQHPYASAAAVTAVALVGTRTAKTAISHRSDQPHRQLQNAAYMRPGVSSELTGTRRTARTRSTDFQANDNTSKSMVLARNLFTGLATAAAMLLRDPNKMRTATNAFSAVSGFVRARRARRPNQSAVKVVRVKQR